MAKRKIKLFKDPKIIKPKSGDWFVLYYFRHPDDLNKWCPFKERCGINRIKDLKEKESEAEILRSDVFNWLLKGNSPFDKADKAIDAIAPMEIAVEKIKAKLAGWSLEKTISEYLTYIVDQGLSRSSIHSYNKYLKAFKAWLNKNGLLNEKASKMTEMIVKLFLDDSFKGNTWSARTYNNYLKFMITFFSMARLLEKNATGNRSLKYEFNPEDLKTKNSIPQRNKAYTPVMVEEMKKHLAPAEFSNLRDYLQWIFLSLMRPNEIRHLKVADIDHVNRQIRIMGKTGDRIIPVSDQLMELINKRELMNKSLKSFVFGYAGNVDERRMSAEYFLDKFMQISKKMALGDKYGPYSFKHTGVIKMIKAGFKDQDIMVLSGHKTQSAFNAYKRDLVIDNESVMKGSTIDF